MKLPQLLLFAVAGAMVLSLTACSKDEKAKPEIRTVKAIIISQISPGQIRRLSGLVQAVDTANLSFKVPGVVQETKVELGDRVKKGDVLARLDPAPYALKLKRANAELEQAKASLYEKKIIFLAKEKLHKKSIIGTIEFESARSSYLAALSQVEAAKASLDIQAKDLNDTIMKAPFDGLVAKKEIYTYEEVKAGQVIYILHGENQYEVLVRIPDTIISNIREGQKVRVIFPSLNRAERVGRVDDIGSSITEASSFPVTVNIVDAPKFLRPGMSAEVEFNYKLPNHKTAYLVPFSALMPGKERLRGYVYIFDSKTQTVHKRAVRVQNIRENMAEVYQGLKPGDIVITAGIHYLTEGQKVKLSKKYFGKP